MRRSVVWLCILLAACNLAEQDARWSDELRQVFDIQDRRAGDSLIVFLSHHDPVIRRAAALAFASLQDTAYAEALGRLLISDTDRNVRLNAAFSLGQTGGNVSLRYLSESLNKDQDSLVNAASSEALGKLVSIQSVTDAAVNENAWYWYRRALLQTVGDTVVATVLPFLDADQPFESRLGAAHFFARGKITAIDNAVPSLIRAAEEDPRPEVRMAAVFALGKSRNETVKELIGRIATTDSDYRVRVNAIRAFSIIAEEDSGEILFAALSDSSLAVQISAAETIRAFKNISCDQLHIKARAAANWRTQAVLYEALADRCADRTLVEELDSLYLHSSNPYQKAALNLAYASSSESIDTLLQRCLKSDLAVVRSSAAQGIAQTDRRIPPERNSREEFLRMYQEALLLNDAAVTAIVADVLSDSARGYRAVVTDLSFLRDAIKKLNLPRDLETFQALSNCIAWFEDKPLPEEAQQYNHPIRWELLESLNTGQQVIVHTTKGAIAIRLLPDEAPGSVANFVGLAASGFYDNKYFHRVVPNFVIQTGCPRGDGWGGEDYSIRSEFTSRRYSTGAVGMASAGKDTEGTQWFITHSPTPHLEGRYTLFGVVEDGMNVVHAIEVGDRIIRTEFVPALSSF